MVGIISAARRRSASQDPGTTRRIEILATDSGSKTFNFADLGFTPVGVIAHAVRCDTTNVFRSSLYGCHGVSAGASQYAAAFRFDGNGQRQMFSGKLLSMFGAGDAEDFAASLTAMTATSITLNITNAAPSKLFVILTFIGGANVVGAACGKIDLPNATSTILNPGIRAHALVTIGTNYGEVDAGRPGNAGWNVGFATFDGASTYRHAGMGEVWQAPGGTRDVQSYLSSVGMFGLYDLVVTMSDVTSTSFKINSTANLTGHDLFYLAIEMVDPTKAWCGIVDIAALGGDTLPVSRQISGAGAWTPKTTLVAFQNRGTVDVSYSDGTGGGCGWASIDSLGGYSNSFYMRDAVLSTTSGSVSDDRSINLVDQYGSTDMAVADLSSMGAGGPTLAFTKLAMAMKWAAMHLG